MIKLLRDITSFNKGTKKREVNPFMPCLVNIAGRVPCRLTEWSNIAMNNEMARACSTFFLLRCTSLI